MNFKIPLVQDTIDSDDIESLISWLRTNPRLTKGEVTEEFEKVWCEWLGVKNSIFVNSGSSANLAAYYTLLVSKRLKNKKVILPAVSWSTTVAPTIQFGFEPILCDCNMNNLGLDVDCLIRLVEEHDPGLIVTVNVLGFANDYEKIQELCKLHNIILLEDSCESIGTVYNGRKTGTFGEISTFSMYYGHHISTIEGGMICTDDDDLANIIKSIRCHGWDRDLPKNIQQEFRTTWGIDDFRALYTFYYPGFNLRATDLQAYLGLQQMKKLDLIVAQRERNYLRYFEKIPHFFGNQNHDVISNFAYPILTKFPKEVASILAERQIETRPLICGSIALQPFWIERFGHSHLKNAETVHNHGMYLPNNFHITLSEIDAVIETLREAEENLL